MKQQCVSAVTVDGRGLIAPRVCSIVARNRASGAPIGPDPQTWSFRIPSTRNRVLVVVRAAPGRAGQFAVQSIDGDLPPTHAEPNWRHSRQAPAHIIWRRGSTASGERGQGTAGTGRSTRGHGTRVTYSNAGQVGHLFLGSAHRNSIKRGRLAKSGDHGRII